MSAILIAIGMTAFTVLMISVLLSFILEVIGVRQKTLRCVRYLGLATSILVVIVSLVPLLQFTS